MGRIGEYQQVRCSSLNWGPRDAWSNGPQLRLLQHILLVNGWEMSVVWAHGIVFLPLMCSVRKSGLNPLTSWIKTFRTFWFSESLNVTLIGGSRTGMTWLLQVWHKQSYEPCYQLYGLTYTKWCAWTMCILESTLACSFHHIWWQLQKKKNLPWFYLPAMEVILSLLK